MKLVALVRRIRLVFPGRKRETKMLDRDRYYMNIAMAVRKKANCLGRRVGAIIVKENRIISTGYNGTPEDVKNCLEGGCVRCRNRETYKKPSVGYDVCICVHAEQNALIAAARFGNSIEGAVVYSTLRPCFDCTKSMLQAKIQRIYYLHEWQHEVGELQEQYQLIQNTLPGGVCRVDITDPHSDWANGRVETPPE
jgi:dCMP deaminase